LHHQEVIIMSSTSRIAIILASLTLTAGIQVAGAPISSATSGAKNVPLTQGPIRCC
jgi:hypothetical protein